ncbi:hypothetical protein L9F63_008575, partial [Diploptera punctata]
NLSQETTKKKKLMPKPGLELSKHEISFCDCGVASRVARVLLVATHPDTSRTPRTPQGQYVSSQAERLLSQLTDKYGTLFELHDQILIVDAHVASSPGIKAVKSYLSDAKHKVLQGVPKWTGFLEGVVNWLPALRRNSASFPVVPWFIFVELVHCNVNPLAGEEHMKELIQQLQLMGEVVYLKSQFQDLVCLAPRWLCSNVIGQLLSLDFVAQARVTGCYTVDDFQVAFSECDALDVLQVLEALQMCTQCENDDELEFEFPCYNFVETLDGLWDASDPRYHDPDSCYGGVKLRTPPDTFHLIHSIFPRIQVQLRRTMQNVADPDSDLYQWFEGSKLCSGLIESLVTLEDDGESIEMKVRGPPGSELTCFYFMEELLGIVDQVLLEMSPGLPIEKHVLSAEQLRLHSDLVHCWSPDELMETILQPSCLNAKLLNPLTGNYESVLDLVGFGASEMMCRQQLSKLLDPPDPLGKDWCARLLDEFAFQTIDENDDLMCPKDLEGKDLMFGGASEFAVKQKTGEEMLYEMTTCTDIKPLCCVVPTRNLAKFVTKNINCEDFGLKRFHCYEEELRARKHEEESTVKKKKKRKHKQKRSDDETESKRQRLDEEAESCNTENTDTHTKKKKKKKSKNKDMEIETPLDFEQNVPLKKKKKSKNRDVDMEETVVKVEAVEEESEQEENVSKKKKNKSKHKETDKLKIEGDEEEENVTKKRKSRDADVKVERDEEIEYEEILPKKKKKHKKKSREVGEESGE